MEGLVLDDLTLSPGWSNLPPRVVEGLKALGFDRASPFLAFMDMTEDEITRYFGEEFVVDFIANKNLLNSVSDHARAARNLRIKRLGALSYAEALARGVTSGPVSQVMGSHSSPDLSLRPAEGSCVVTRWPRGQKRSLLANDGEGSRKRLEQAERERWVKELIEDIKFARLPVVRRSAGSLDPDARLRYCARGRRSHLRCAWDWLLPAFPWPCPLPQPQSAPPLPP